ncbi:hypothetical protein Tco_0211590 [Tanacetum coccineum]
MISSLEATLFDVITSQLQSSPDQLVLPIHRGNAASRQFSISDALVPLIKPLSNENLVGEASTFGVPVTATTTTLLTTFVQVSIVPPISAANHEVSGAGLSAGVPSPSKVVFEKEELETTPEHTTLRTFQVCGRSFPLRSLSLYDLLPSAYVTSYGHSHLGLSFPLSVAWLASLFRYTRSPGLKLVLQTLKLKYFSIFALLLALRMIACSFLSSKRSRLISKASLLCTMSTSSVLKVSIPISVGMTASVQYISENGVSPLHDLIMVISELISVIRYYFSWQAESADYVIPYKLFDLIALIMEYLVKISKKARILELKRRYLKITVLTTNTPYPGKTNTPYSIHMEIKYSGRYQTWPVLQEIPNTPYRKLLIRRSDLFPDLIN